MNSKDRIAATKLFLLDLDGTVYRGDAVIPGALEFISRLRRQSIPYVFLTNNSSHSAAEYRKRLSGMGFPVTKKNILTSGQATGHALAQKKPGARVFVLGTRALKKELASYGLTIVDGKSKTDFVVAGFDTELTYAKLVAACELIDAGVAFVATNPDFVCPIRGKRAIPDCGSICLMIAQATGKRPLVIGKPQQGLVKLACAAFNVRAGAAAMIGDRLYTDVAMGRRAGILTVAVLTGETTRDEIRRSKIRPDIIMNSIDDMNRYFSASGKK
ncbi:MAG: HAD-IIA family hydrolase [Chitinispirillaceae bacterium]|jgi:HAD superfamily hydrolase (TIGR01457 family)|nr:HAD-IIA family hydrolase [Chitinispirillaceae bacterium]